MCVRKCTQFLIHIYVYNIIKPKKLSKELAMPRIKFQCFSKYIYFFSISFCAYIDRPTYSNAHTHIKILIHTRARPNAIYFPNYIVFLKTLMFLTCSSCSKTKISLYNFLLCLLVSKIFAFKVYVLMHLICILKTFFL